MADANSPPPGMAQQLEALQALHDLGTLSDSEFAAAKARLLTPDVPGAAQPSRRTRWPKRLLLLVAVLVVIAGFAVALVARRGSEPSGPSRSPIEQAVHACNSALQSNVGDAGASVTFDTEGEDDFTGDDLDDVECVLDFLKTPDRVRSRIASTRALDGTLEAKWGQFEAFWTYHPDNGLDITIFMPE